MDVKILVANLGSSFLGAIITSFYNKLNNDINNHLKYITEERCKWRKLIRKNITEIVSTENITTRTKLICELELNLNPKDKEDNRLIECAKKLINSNDGNIESFKEELLLYYLLQAF